MTEGMVRCEGWQVCRDSACYHRGLHHPMSACDNACQRSRGHSTSAKCKPIGKIMSEKQTDKPTVRTLISVGIITDKTDGETNAVFDNVAAARKLQPGDRVELAKLTNAEPKRKLVPGPGEWKRTQLVGANWYLINESGVIAIVSRMGCTQWYWATLNKCGHVETHELAERAAEEALADARLCGFHWEEVEPEYWFYTVLCDETDHTSAPSPIKWKPFYSREKIQHIFDDAVAEGNWKDVRLLGFNVSSTGDLQMDELDRYEAEEKP